MICEIPEHIKYFDDIKLVNACLELLKKEKITNQAQIKSLLLEQGFKNVNQSLISRLFAHLGVVKITNAAGEKIYSLVPTSHAHSVNKPIKHQILTISHNNFVVIVKTEKGFAQAVEQFFKYNCQNFILGCIGGFNSVMLVPAKKLSARQCEQKIRAYLQRIPDVLVVNENNQ